MVAKKGAVAKVFRKDTAVVMKALSDIEDVAAVETALKDNG